MFTSGSTSDYPLNEHVLGEIFSLVYDTSYSTVRSLLLTDRFFHSITRPLLYRHVALNIASLDFVEEVLSWLNDPEKAEIPRSIRHIYVGDFYGSAASTLTNEYSMRVIGKAKATRRARDREEEWAAITNLISRTTQLKSLTFASHDAIPLALLNAIHNYPTMIDLNISSWTRSSPSAAHDDPAELALLGSPCLKSLQAHFYNHSSNPGDLRSHAFWRLVRSAPNLHSVVLIISYGGCVASRDSDQQKQLWAALGENFMDSKLVASKSKLQNLKIMGGELASWRGGDLSQVTTLDCTGALSLHRLASFTSLRHLTLRGSHTTINSVLMDCSPLTSLNVIEWHLHLSLKTVLPRHGQSLRSFALHELESIDINKPRTVLGLTDLHYIRDLCPNLHDLSLDLNISARPASQSSESLIKDHKPVYDFLSTLPFLRRLQLNFNLGIDCYNPGRFLTSGNPEVKERDRVPIFEKSFVDQVWYTLHGVPGRATSSKLKLKELRVAQGEAQRPSRFGYPGRWVAWERSNHRWFKVTPSERDDEMDRITITRYSDAPDFDQDIWRECRW